MGEECPNCRQLTNASFSRLVKDTCGHTKCRMCLLYEEQGCKACQEEHRIRTIGNFDYPPSKDQEIENMMSLDVKPSLINEEIILPMEVVINRTSSQFEFVSDNLNADKDCTNRLISNNDKIGNREQRENLNNIDPDSATSRLHIPKIEPLELVSNIRTHLEKTSEDKESIQKAGDSNKMKSTCTEDEKGIKNKVSRKCPDRSHILTVPGIPERYKCNVCGKIFRNKKGKCYHDACVTGVRPYHCKVCDKSFVKRSHFEYHERVHTGYKPHKCTICDKAFPQRNKLNRHMYSHNKNKDFTCPKCGKGYRRREDLKYHINAHAGIAPYTCKVCNKSFRMLTNLRRHMRTHSSERPYSCEQCSKSFKDKCLLVRHKRTHGKERPFSCAHCIRVFLSKSELRRHLTVHSDEKPFSCQFCRTVFRRKDNLNRHIRHHHSEDSVYEIEKTHDKSQEKDTKPSKAKTIENLRQKQKSRKLKRTSILLSKSPPKASIIHTNSSDQINSRLDPMGNITPVIRATGELSNAVPVINGPISIKKPLETTNTPKKTFTHTEPIPLAEAVVINRRIEEKLYPQNSSNHNYFFRNCSNQNERQLPIHKLSLVRSNLFNKHVANKFIVPEKFTVNSELAPTHTDRQLSNEGTRNTKEIMRSQEHSKPQHFILKRRAIGDFENKSIDIDNTDQRILSHKNMQLSTVIDSERTNCISTIKRHTVYSSDQKNCDEHKKHNGIDGIPHVLSIKKVSEVHSIKKRSDLHWRRRTAEILKPCID
ncbi:zinc finger imprinted 3 [Orussus abietinus]|uniref:zinc finger imprinted 3 n=1 Tax=Orussus abietinus TaxID=222816 RepID=UPI000624FC79|nr:zinc finger imprinted 3 [Orussus abietinus]